MLRYLMVCAGLVALSNGYTTRPTCPPCPVADCGLVPQEFQYTCPNGNILDQCGCVSSCQCAGCPRFNANLPCPGGKVVDENGCPTSKCKCSQCAPNECGLRLPEFQYTCPNGNILDDCGCVRSCQCAGCPSFDENLSCPYGKIVDANGCPTSSCNPPPPCQFAGDCAAVTCEAGKGNAVDENGCPLQGCPCQGAANCPPVVGCTLNCSTQGGYKTGPNGCVVCECAGCQPSPFPTPSCPHHPGCAPFGGCTLDCSNQGGYKRDAWGCRMCQCRIQSINKPGRCPSYRAWGATTCTNDADCLGRSKCCRKSHIQKVCTRPM